MRTSSFGEFPRDILIVLPARAGGVCAGVEVGDGSCINKDTQVSYGSDNVTCRCMCRMSQIDRCFGGGEPQPASNLFLILGTGMECRITSIR